MRLINTFTKIISLLVLVLGSSLYFAQLTDSENYVYSKTHLSAPEELVQKTSETVTYFDGLGRPKQTIMIKAGKSPANDLVVPVVYDCFGRQVRDYLPIPQNTSSSGGIYTQNSDCSSTGNQFPVASPTTVYFTTEKIYSEKVLESSPLDRVFQQIQPGTDWQSHPVNYDYQTNTATDVLKFSTETLPSGGAFYTNKLIVNGYYPASTLYKNMVSDEDGKTTFEFKNGEGQTLLVRKVQGDDMGPSIAPQPTATYIDTYYIYNEYNQLAFVISPLAVNEFRANSSQTINKPKTVPNAIIDNLCYQYNYDGRNRLVEKKLPGKGWESMVYDKQDRLIFTQDSSLASSTNQFGEKGWLFTKYDQFSRVVYTGFVASNDDRATVQGIVNNSTTIISNNESRSSSSGNYSGLDLYYTNVAFPSVITKLLSVNYYDTYPDETPFPDQNKILNQPILVEAYDSLGRSTKSLPLASFVKNIDDDSWTKNFSFYDRKGRAIGTTSINHLGGSTVVGSELDFAGVVKQTQTLHNRIASEIPVNIIEDFTYDHQNRLLKHYHEVVGKTPKELLADNTYDDLGRLTTKKVGAVSDGSFTEVSPALQTIKYDYNIRGWMTGINLNATGGLDTGKLFSYKIKYNDPVNTAIKKYNGNIAEIDWLYQDEDAQRYEYSYDDLNRLKRGNYKSLGQTTTTDSKFYNEELTYDVNGNIKTLKRNARPQLTTQPAVQVDDLTYVYENTNKSNRLSTVYDNAQNSNGYPDIIVPQPMTYDVNGNMLTMPDKGITGNIVYNYLNLPQTVTKDGNATTYTYRADGVKIHKQFTFDGNNIDTDYLDGFVYTTPYSPDLNGALLNNPEAALAGQKESFELADLPIVVDPGPINLTEASPNFFPTTEGFYDYDNFKYIYQYKDHLGNVRLSFDRSPDDGSAEILSNNDYYPFGLNFINIHARTSHPPVYNPSVSFENFKYNGKELEETGMYDYGARMYMPDIGRWEAIDPLAEKYRRHSIYNYAADNPIRFIDVDGRFIIDPNLTKEQRAIVQKAINNAYRLLQDPKVRNSMIKWGNTTWKKIQNDFTDGKGPLLNFESDLKSSSGKAVYGKYLGNKKGTGEFFINSDNVDSAIANAGSENELDLIFVLSATIMHEYVHKADDEDGVDDNPGLEEGAEFETEAFGTVIDNNNTNMYRPNVDKHWGKSFFKKQLNMYREMDKAKQELQKAKDALNVKKKRDESIKDLK